MEHNTSKAERRLVVRPVKEHASCNCCGRSNYISERYPNPQPTVDRLFDVVIGMMCNRMCPECLSVMTEMVEEAIEE